MRLKMQVKVVAVFLAMAILLFPTISRAAENPDQQVLRGLKGVSVAVGKIRREAERLGLDTEKIKTDVELRLRKAGIKVLTGQEMMETPGMPYLLVSVNATVGSGICAYAIDVDLHEAVTLDRGPRIHSPVWNAAYAGWVGTNKIREIRGHVGDLVDKFINDYLVANPK
jgi:hypothetical protein